MLKVLIVRLSSLGDIIHSYPILHDIKANFPDSQVDWLVDEDFIDLVKCNPLIDNIIVVPLRKIKRNKLKIFRIFNEWKKQLNKTKYDCIIDPQGLLKSAILAKFFGSNSHGFGKNSIREKLAAKLYKYSYEFDNNILTISKNRLLAAQALGYKNYDLNNINFGISEQKFLMPNISELKDKDYCLFFQATAKNSKKYPIKYWVILANYINSRYKFKIMVTYGNAVEYKEALEIKQLANCSSDIYVPDRRYSYSELHGIIQHSKFVFGVDTGLTHLANALNKKIIDINVDTDPNKAGVIKSDIAKNVGNKGIIPEVSEIIQYFEKIIKI